MGNKKLHPTVEQFKVFVKEHPKLISEVKNGSNTLQSFYEDWYLLGEEDPFWEKYRNNDEGDIDTPLESNEKTETDGKWMKQIGSIIQKVDANQMQYHLNNLSQVIASVQGVLAQFQGEKQSTAPTNEQRNPFSFRKD
ncbi:YlbD family protein [Heyndrickxia vini]|uniref:YlbD family protein n=1 Tax=Heyndrickxia vini TaxID=1476025 RepID=A0ABX7DX51_9BACI|nr:YlbD family protein [Heyndrickxia vini]QQZ08064.1 YlbD family protein [Heyndrickxia vini]